MAEWGLRIDMKCVSQQLYYLITVNDQQPKTTGLFLHVTDSEYIIQITSLSIVINTLGLDTVQ